MKINNIYIFKTRGYNKNTKEYFDRYSVSVTLEDSRETKVEVNLTDDEQGKLFEALSEILPAKLNEFSADFAKSLRSDENE